ncbi:hypothetical protein C1Y18_23425 [Pseudomonas sp. MPR-R5A]|nr:hypothetical protein C1Y25_09300 [Pseudomonas sp. MPBC4-3]PMX48956.1 hypothetical protein C1Y20_08035 [Pseudomonas sp. FW301-21B01]PMY04223.1 hypothetical protein C1Y18_23425 [Pseudomonas sp. MPR-R5A]
MWSTRSWRSTSSLPSTLFCSKPYCRSIKAFFVGASLLAKNSQAPRSFREPTLSLTFFASKPAPTEGDVRFFESPQRYQILSDRCRSYRDHPWPGYRAH